MGFPKSWIQTAALPSNTFLSLDSFPADSFWPSEQCFPSGLYCHFFKFITGTWEAGSWKCKACSALQDWPFNLLIQIEQIKYITCCPLGVKEGKRMFMVYIANHFFSQICGVMLDCPALQRTPLQLEPELAWFHEFRGKTLEGLFEPLVYFSSRTGDLFFST